MTPAAFRRWRKALGLSQKEAAEALGLKRRVVQYYEKGERDGAEVQVPRAVRLACYALAAGVTDYAGPREDGDMRSPARIARAAPSAGPAGAASGRAGGGPKTRLSA